LIARNLPSRRRFDALDWRGPPELIEHVTVSDDERRLIAAFALQRLKTARVEMDLTQLDAHQFEKSR
jgi:hypothetical protein